MKVNKHPHIDDNGSSYLFGGKFEEKSIKVTNAKQKSKVLFPGLQSKPAANDQQPFRASSLPQNPSMRRGHRFFLGRGFNRGKITLSKTVFSAESGNPHSRDLHASASSNKKPDFSNKSAQNPNKRAASVFSWELVKDDKRHSHSRYCEGLPKTFCGFETLSGVSSSFIKYESGRNLIRKPGNSGIVRGRNSKVERTVIRSVSQFNISDFQEKWGSPLVINLKKLNQHIPYEHFKMEGLFLLKELLQKGDYMYKIDLKDAYFSMSFLHQGSQIFLGSRGKHPEYSQT